MKIAMMCQKLKPRHADPQHPAQSVADRAITPQNRKRLSADYTNFCLHPTAHATLTLRWPRDASYVLLVFQ